MELSALHNRTSGIILDAALAVHRELGPGLLESIYEQCLAVELADRRVGFERQVAVPLIYKGEPLDTNLRIDLMVADLVVVEIKAVDRLLPIHEAQLLTYMKLARRQLGLLINFNVPVIKLGVRRIVRSADASTDLRASASLR